MAKRGRPRKRPAATQKQINMTPDDGVAPKPDRVEWVTVRVPIYTGNMGTRPHDVRIQSPLDSKDMRETWMRIHMGYDEANAEVRNQMARPLPHTRVGTIHALLNAVHEAMQEVMAESSIKTMVDEVIDE